MQKKFGIYGIIIMTLALLTGMLCGCRSGCKHNLSKTYYHAPDCTTDGNLEYWECSVCGKKFMDESAKRETENVVLPATHKVTKIEYAAPDCTTDGNLEHWECSACGKKFTDQFAKHETENVVLPAVHELTKTDYVAPGCTTDGNPEYWECSVCKKKFTDEAATQETEDVVLPAAHQYGDYSYDYDTREYSRSCSECGDVDIRNAGSEEFPVLARSETELIGAIEAVKSVPGSVIKLSNDITVTAGMYASVLRLPEGGTLDLGGHTVTVKNNGGFLVEGTDVTLQNGRVVTDYADPAEGYSLYVGDEGENNRVTVRNLQTSGGINVFNCEATLYDCHVDASNHTYYALWADEHSTITVESGTYLGGEYGCVHSCASANPEGNGNIVLNGGTFQGRIYATACTRVNGGEINGDVVLTVYSNVNAKLVVSKDYGAELNILVGSDKYRCIYSTDANGNRVYETERIDE